MNSRVAVTLALSLLGCDAGDSCEDAKCVRETVECRSDDDCADGLACNGDETCEAAHCAPGTPVECASGLSCVEGAGETSCEFLNQSSWFVYIGDDLGAEPFRLFGIRQADMGHATPLDLTEEIVEGYAGPTFRGWSPDGRFLVFDLATSNFESRLFYLEFGAGLPSKAVPLPDLPVSDGWTPEVNWSGDSKSAVMRESDDLYFLDFHGETATTSLLVRDDATVTSATPCADGVTVVYDIEEEERSFVGTAPGLEDAEPLPGYALVSPGGTHIAVVADDAVWTAECGVGKRWRFHEIGALADDFSAGWSPDGRFLELPVASEDGESADLAVVDARGDEPPWRAAGSTFSALWARRAGAHLVFESSPDWMPVVASFPGGVIEDLGLPEVSTVDLHESGVSFVVSDEETRESSEWVRLDGWSDAVRLDGCGDEVTRYNQGPSLAACTQEVDDGWNLFVFSLGADGSVSRARPATTLTERLTTEEFSPDGRGLIVMRSSMGYELRQQMLWVGAPFMDDVPLAEISQGTLAYDGEWQPTPPPDERRR
jgi:hypothetical protein